MAGGIFDWIAQLNADRFAGHGDWRIPNVKELQSIVDYGTYNPAANAVFNTNCTSACTVDGANGTTECSGTNHARPGFSFYWSATTDAGLPSRAWTVYFNVGSVGNDTETDGGYVRAVRCGLVRPGIR